MRQLLARRDSGDSLAELAIDSYVRAIRKTIGSYAVLLGGLDQLVFTGGIGEHSQQIRSMICHRMEFLSLSDTPDCARIVVLPAEEERQIARICRSIGSTVLC